MNEELEMEQEEPQQSGIQTFDAPKIRGQKAQFGRSFVDLSNPENEQAMWDQYRTWWRMKKGEERNRLENKWYQTYYGMDTVSYKKAKDDAIKNDYFNNPLERLQGIFKFNTAIAAGGVDFVGDAAATIIPPYRKVDNFWDESTKFEDPIYQSIRSLSSIVLPSMLAGGAISAKQAILKTPTTKLGHVGRWLQNAGLHASADSAIIALSDHKFEPNLPRHLSDSFPGIFGPKGRVPIPDIAKTLDSDSLTVNMWKHMLTDGGFSVLGSVLGSTIDIAANRKILDWFIPKDDAAKAYKQAEIYKEADPEIIKEIRKLQVELNEGLTEGTIDAVGERELMDQIMTLEDQLKNPGSGGELIRRDLNRKDIEETTAGLRKIDDPTQLELDYGADPDLTPGLLKDNANPRRIPPAGNIARNKADIAALAEGNADGAPAPIITEAMRTKGLQLDETTRSLVLGVSEATREVGDFDAIVDMVRVSGKDMDALAMGIYEDIINADTAQEVGELFLKDRSVIKLFLGKANVSYASESKTRAAGYAIKYLFDKYIGLDINLASSRVMQTTGKEISTMSESLKVMKETIDDDKVKELILDKLQILLDEYALNKYISGWQLRNKNWFNGLPPDSMQEAAESLTKEFESAELAIRQRNLNFRNRLEEAKVNNPQIVEPLIDAFIHTNGKVDSIARLAKWTSDQLTPMGLLRSPDPKEMNLFARGVVTNVMNSWLTGKAAFNAAKYGIFNLTVNPIVAFMGHGLTGRGKEWHGLKQALYYNSSVMDVNIKSAKHSWQMMKKAWNDPKVMARAYRKDFMAIEDKRWAVLDKMVPVWEAEGNQGMLFQYHMARNLKNLGNNPVLRSGMTGLTGVDFFVNGHISHYVAKLETLADVMDEFGYFNKEAARQIELAYFNKYWNKDGTVKDHVVKAIAGEINLNLDDGVANWINQATTTTPILKSIIAFPRTASQGMKVAASWTPITLIPGSSKYAKTIYAKTGDEIAEALVEHGIDPSHPHAREIFEDRRAHYVGRLAFSAFVVALMWGEAIAGKLVGNGHFNPAQRARDRRMGQRLHSWQIGDEESGFVMNTDGTPISSLVNATADMAAHLNNLDEAFIENIQNKLTWTLMTSFAEGTPLFDLDIVFDAKEGNLAGVNRWLANLLRGLIPMGGALGVLNKAINSAQKDIEGEIWEHLAAQIPLVSNLLPDQVNFWNGEPINDVKNPVLRALNAALPVKITQPLQPHEKWYIETGHPGMNRTKKSLDGTHTWTPTERSALHRKMGQYNGEKELIRISKNKKYNDLLAKVKTMRHNNSEIDDFEVTIKTALLPLYTELDYTIDQLRRKGEYDLVWNDPEFAYLQEKFKGQRLTDAAMREGNIPKALRIQKQTENLIQMRK